MRGIYRMYLLGKRFLLHYTSCVIRTGHKRGSREIFRKSSGSFVFSRLSISVSWISSQVSTIAGSLFLGRLSRTQFQFTNTIAPVHIVTMTAYSGAPSWRPTVKPSGCIQRTIAQTSPQKNATFHANFALGIHPR